MIGNAAFLIYTLWCFFGRVPCKKSDYFYKTTENLHNKENEGKENEGSVPNFLQMKNLKKLVI